jgi:hypothetical protein
MNMPTIDGMYSNTGLGVWSQNVAVAGSTAQSADSGINSPQTLTKAAVTGKSHYITSLEVSISGAAAANDITISLKDGSTVVWKEIIGSGAPRGERAGIVFTSPIKMTAATATTLVVDAGGAGVLTSANLAGYTA